MSRPSRRRALPQAPLHDARQAALAAPGIKLQARRFWWLFRKDLLTEWRTRETLLTLLFFAFLLVVIFSFSLWSDEEVAVQVAPGVIWIALSFTGSLSIDRSFAQEQEGQTLTALLLVPGVRQALFFSKALLNLLYMSVVAALVCPLVLLILSVPVPLDGVPALLCALLAGMVGYAVVGTVFSAMLVTIRRRGVLLPIVLYPVLIPLLVMGVEACGAVLEDRPLVQAWSWIRIMAAVDVLYLMGGIWLFGQVLEEE